MGGDDTVPRRQQLHVHPDHGAEWPVWDESGLASPEDFPGLSPCLVAELHAWQQRWAAGPGSALRYRSWLNAPDTQPELDRLARHLAREFRDVADVRTDTWSSTD
ncbi:hypothetical protein [Pseudokineococcus sp. 1T1Z-3]|uniref:hypothetical protein n=1 Tax=Pseudokineococcus sp. 1T1Z-3 TaxID=3132745 RepID=UPI0030A37B50